MLSSATTQLSRRRPTTTVQIRSVPGLIAALLALFSPAVRADEPLLRVEPSGSTSYVTSVVFGPDNKTLYAAGRDKIVRVWKLDEPTGRFEVDPSLTYRVPIDPGQGGMINGMDISADGQWLVVGGTSLVTTAAQFGDLGQVMPSQGAMTPEMRADMGRVIVFNTRTREMRSIRSHLGSVISVKFLNGSSRYLVSAAIEWDVNRESNIGVVRMFDVQEREYLYGAIMPELNSRPGLAPIGTAETPQEARIAIGWGDDKLRVWDLAAEKMFPATDQATENAANNLVIFDPASNRLVSSTFTSPRGVVTTWDPRSTGLRPRRVGDTVSMNAVDNEYPFPRAMALLKGRDSNLALVVNRMTIPTDVERNLPTRIAGWQLRGFQLQSRGAVPAFSLELNDVPTGIASANRAAASDLLAEVGLPTLATSNDGRFVALAGAIDHVIRVYRADDLLRGQSEPFQRLTGRGVRTDSARFVRNGDRRGILLEGVGADRSLVFDVSSRAMVEHQPRDWNDDSPNAGDFDVTWQTVEIDGQRVVELRTRGPGLPGEGSRVRLSPSYRLSAYTVLPAFDQRDIPVDFPILAVASLQDPYFTPRLELFNLRTGDPIRRYTGHRERIHSIAFSGDGRFLASAANDRTVAIWSLTDLDKTVGRRGGIDGLKVDLRNDAITVVEPGPQADSRGSVRAGDQIAAITSEDREHEIESARDVYDAFWLSTPGSTVTIRFANRDATASLVVEQGIDERKALFSLYVQPIEGGAVEWVGWSPLGPFDSSGREIERHLGWHFNGETVDDAVRFAHLDQYPELRREGILEMMLQQGQLPRLEAAPLPAPTMTIRVPEATRGGRKQPPTVTRRPSMIELITYGITPRDVQLVELLVDNEPAVEMPFVGQQKWAIELADQPWNRGVHRLTARLTTNEAKPQTFEQDLDLLFQLAPPRISLNHKAQNQVEDSTFTVSGEITGTDTESVLLELRHTHNDEQVTREQWTFVDSQDLSHDVELREGLNHFQVIATNEGAAGPSASNETSVVRFAVSYEPRRPSPISAIEAEIFGTELGADSPRPRALEAGGLYATSTARPRLILIAEAEGELPELTVSIKPKSAAEPTVLPIEFNQAEDFWRTTAALDLTEVDVYRLRVVDNDNEKLVFETTLVRQPSLPSLTLESPLETTTVIEGVDDQAIDLVASLTGGDASADFEAVVLLNGNPAEVPVSIEDGQLAAKVPLSPGTNRLQLQISSDFQQSATRPVVVRFVSPPAIDSAVAEPSDGPMCRITISGSSSSEIRDVLIDGRSWPDDLVEISTDGESFTAILTEVPLQEGDNEFAVSVRNAEAESVRPGLASLEYVVEVPGTPAEVVVLQPRGAAVTDQSQVEIKFDIKSTSRFFLIEVQRDGIPVFHIDDVASIRPNTDGEYRIRARTTVELKPGPNHFEVVVLNEVGENVVDVETITYQERPVRLRIDGIALERDATELIEPEVLADGRISFPRPVDKSVVWIHATADWQGLPDTVIESDLPTIRVLVNEFMQISSGRINDRESKFQLPIVLNRDSNQIRVELPHYKGEASSQVRFDLGCGEPTKNQRLHLLVVGIGIEPAEQPDLESRVMEGLRAERQANSREFRTETFQNGLIYGPLLGTDLTQGDVLGELINIQETVNVLSADKDVNDVVMIYVEGGRIVPQGKEFLITTRPADSRISLRIADNPNIFSDYSLGSSVLQAMVDTTEGAQVVMLELVEGTEQLSEVSFDDRSRAALLRYTWVKSPDTTPGQSTILDVLTRVSGAIRLEQLNEQFQLAAADNDGLRYLGTLPDAIRDLLLIAR